MALKATIFKVDLALADMDRNLYANYALTLARHPSDFLDKQIFNVN